MLIDAPALYRDLSIRNNLKLQGRVLGDLPKGRIGKLMKALHITPRDTGNRSVGGCPAGLKMKCAIAMAMLPFPRLLLLDEVFGGLDTDDSALFRDLAEAEMAERPMALLITGQFFSELYPFATDYLLLQKGKITRTYTREELQARIPEDLHRSQELEDAFRNSGPAGAAVYMRTPKVKGQPETAVLQDDPKTQYENIIDVFWACSPYYFRWILASNQGLLVIPLVFVIMFLARDFPNRVFNDSLYIGKRRRDVFWAKTLFYFLLAFLVSLVGILLLTVVYAGGAFRYLPAGYVWSRMAIHALMDACLMAVPFLLAFLLRNTVLTGFVTALYCVLIRYTNVIWPAAVKADKAIWAQGTFPLTPTLVCLGLLVVCVGVSRVLFEKQDLK